MRDYLALHGRRLLEAGYEIVPIKPGLKHPGMDGWQKVPSSQKNLDAWLANGRAHDGVGIRTAATPAIDIDVTDKEMADDLEVWCHERLGLAPVRVGLAPKRLLVYRTDEPFRKMQSTWLDHEGTRHKVEILGEGQQFVAWAVHPDTRKPYRWSADTPLNTLRSKLPILTAELGAEVLAAFDQFAQERGWTRPALQVAHTRAQSHTVLPASPDDALAFAQDPVDVDKDTIVRYLDSISSDDYDVWLHVGMALQHQFGDDGLDIWHDWSAKSDKYAEDVLNAKWKSFKESQGTRRVVTARYIIKMGRSILDDDTRQNVNDTRSLFTKAQTVEDLKAAAEKAMDIGPLGQVDRDRLIGAFRNAWRRVEGSPLSESRARAIMPLAIRDIDDPNWAKGWAYLTMSDKFYHVPSGSSSTRVGFDSQFNRRMITEAQRAAGKTMPDTPASTFVLNAMHIPTADHLVYMPGEDDFFHFQGRPVVNSYRRNLVPAVPRDLTKMDEINIGRVHAHFANLIPDARERDLLLSFLGHIARGGRRINWAVMLQGVEGDGKSFITPLMGAVLGSDNVKTIDGKTLESGFNDWASGSQLAVVEEVKLHGNNRHDVMNTIKPLITNSVIAMRVKYEGHYQVPNTQSYVLLTNFVDALPINNNDRRYFVLRSDFQTAEDVRSHLRKRPSYFVDLFKALDESPGALRRWLIEMPLHPEFDPVGRAPLTKARDYMIAMSRSAEDSDIEATLKETQREDVTEELLIFSRLRDEIEALTESVLTKWEIRRYLLSQGWTCLGRRRLGKSVEIFWSKKPKEFELPDGSWDWDKIIRWAQESL